MAFLASHSDTGSTSTPNGTWTTQPKPMADPILDSLVARILAQVPGIQRIILFGSRATGHARPDSD